MQLGMLLGTCVAGLPLQRLAKAQMVNQARVEHDREVYICISTSWQSCVAQACEIVLDLRSRKVVILNSRTLTSEIKLNAPYVKKR